MKNVELQAVNGVTEAVILELTVSCRCIKTVRIDRCLSLTSITHFAYSYHLSVLSITGCTAVPDDNLQWMAHTPGPRVVLHASESLVNNVLRWDLRFQKRLLMQYH